MMVMCAIDKKLGVFHGHDDDIALDGKGTIVCILFSDN